MRITVIGAGYVGLVTSVGLASLGHSVRIVERAAERLSRLRAGEVPIHEDGLQAGFDAARARGLIELSETVQDDEPDVVMVCVGTPIGDSGRSDLHQFRSALEQLRGAAPNATIVIRSTLPIGTSRAIRELVELGLQRVLFNPEFLRQGTALRDFLAPTRVVFGRYPETEAWRLDQARVLFADLKAPIIVVDVTASELIKNGANAFLALKLTFTNELALLSEAYGVDVGVVLEGIGLDPRIGNQYLRPGLGFGGSCLPKELATVALSGTAVGLEMHVTSAASAANEAHQRRFAQRVASAVGGTDGKRIGILGLAFKAGTDDVRASPAIRIADLLMAGGAEVWGLDPEANDNAVRALPSLKVTSSLDELATGADAIVIATDWPEFQALDWKAVAGMMHTAVVVDGRRLLSASEMIDLGFSYHAVGLPQSHDGVLN